MPPVRVWGWLGLLGGCAAPRATCPAAATAPPPVVAVAAGTAREKSPVLSVEISSDPKVENLIHVRLDLAGELARAGELRFRPVHPVTLREAKARDEKGAVEVTQGADALQLAASGARRELHVEYTVAFAESAEAGAPYAESIEVHASGEDVLALPVGAANEAKVSIRLHIQTGGIENGGASSFGLGRDITFEARPSELFAGYFLGGEIGRAEFHAADGDDFTAWTGHTAFDPRWIGAEVAATRGEVDIYVGRQHGAAAPPLSFLVVPTKRDDPPLVLMPRARGYLASVDRRAVWNAPARILVAQALAQRYIGGFLSIEPRESEQSHFWSEGFSRAVGQAVMFESGMIDKSDRANEINQLLATLAFATEPRRLLAARGALVATALGPKLSPLVRELMTEAANRKVDVLPYSQLSTRLNGLDTAPEIPLPADLLGKCWRLEKKQLVPFELGFVSTAGEELIVKSVVPKSRAEAAGVRPDDVIEKIDYQPNNSAIPVKLTLRRGEKKWTITYSPTGAARPGRVFTRVSGIPDERC